MKELALLSFLLALAACSGERDDLGGGRSDTDQPPVTSEINDGSNQTDTATSTSSQEGGGDEGSSSSDEADTSDSSSDTDAADGTGTTTSVAISYSASLSEIRALSSGLADGVSPVTIAIVIRDDSGRPVSGVVPEFTATGSGNAYTACSATDLDGASSCGMTSTKAEAKILVLTSPIFKEGGEAVFSAGSPASVAITGPETGTTGACVGPFSIETRDSAGNSSPADRDAQFDLASTSEAAFFADSDCMSSIDAVSLAAGAGSAQFYLRQNEIVSNVVSASDSTGVWTAGSVAYEGEGSRQIAAGTLHTCALGPSNEVKCWGYNHYGQLGLGDRKSRGNEEGEMGDALPAVDLGSGNTAIQLATGAYHTCALLANGRVKCWGQNMLAQLGLGDRDCRGGKPGDLGDQLPYVDLGNDQDYEPLKAIEIVAGNFHTCAILEDHSVKCWGYGSHGRLGLGNSKTKGNSEKEMGCSLPFVDLGSGEKVVHLVAGDAHTCAVLADHGVKCWGWNRKGQLGLGDDEHRGNEKNEMGDSLPRIDLSSHGGIAQIAAGGEETCVILADDGILCWGANDHGQLGLGDKKDRGDDESVLDLTPITLNGLAPTRVAVGDEHACAVFDDGTLRCWGRNQHGQLGIGHDRQVGDGPSEMGSLLEAAHLIDLPAILGLSMRNQVCAWFDDSTARCWGANGFGRLGIGDTVDRGDDPWELEELDALDLF